LLQDFVKNNGSGGECVFPGKKGGFKDDPAGLKIKMDARGLVAMGNSGKNTNTSQFFVTLGDVSKLTGKHVVFGKLVEGEDVLALMEQYAATMHITQYASCTDLLPSYMSCINVG
jgi:peptidylprolyl isomerase